MPFYILSYSIIYSNNSCRNHLHLDSNSGHIFHGCGPCFYDLVKTNYFFLGTVLLFCLVSELQDSTLPGHEPRTVFWGFGLSSCHLLFKTNSFGLGAFLLSCLVSELQKLPSPGLALRTIFKSLDLSEMSSWLQGISMPSLVKIGLLILEL